MLFSPLVTGSNNLQADVLRLASSFADKPYIAHSLECFPEPEKLTIRTDAFDCMTYVETVMAMATAKESQVSNRALSAAITKWRYRDGKLNGYESRLHYASDWAIDNVRNGLVQLELPNEIRAKRDINFMSRNRKSYPALADNSSFLAIKEIEERLSQRNFSYLPSSYVNETRGKLESADIIMFVSSKSGLDIAHLGIFVSPNSFWHASSTKKKVVLESDLQKYLKMNDKSIKGIQVYRLHSAAGRSAGH